MKKITICLIIAFIFGLIPSNYVLSITQKQITAEVQIVCPDNYGNWYSGSGTVIDSKGIILTNKHVVTDQYGVIIRTCFIGFNESISQEPNFGTKASPNLAEVKYFTVTDDMDAAILYLDNPTNKTYPFVSIWDSNSNSLKLGDKLEVIGFPSIGGSTITYTSGDFSGFGSQSDGTQNYIKTTAILEHGNSGGSAYDPSGKFIGIPTMVVTGSLNSISYLLSVNSIKNWLSGILGSSYKQEVIQDTPVIIKPTVSIQNDVTPPHYNQNEVSLLQFDSDGNLKNRSSIRDSGAIYEFPKVSFGWDQDCTGETSKIQRDVCIMDDASSIEGYYYYFGTDPSAIPKEQGKYISANEMLRDTYFNLPYAVKLPLIFDAKPGRNYFILQAKDANNNISNPLINLEYLYEGETFKDIKEFKILDKGNKTLGWLTYPLRDLWEYESRVIETNQSSLILCPDYGYDIDGLIYYTSYQDDKWWSDKTRKGIVTKNKCITVSNLDTKKVTNLFIKPNTNSINSFFGKHHVLTINYQSNISNKVQPANKILMTNWNNNTVYWMESKNGMIFVDGSTVASTPINELGLFKIANNSAVYRLINGKKYLFPNRDVFSTWLGDDFAGLREVDQVYFDSVPLGGNLTAKSGNYIKFDNSDNIYLTQSGNGICKAGSYSGKTYIIQSGFEADYKQIGNCQ